MNQSELLSVIQYVNQPIFVINEQVELISSNFAFDRLIEDSSFEILRPQLKVFLSDTADNNCHTILKSFNGQNSAGNVVINETHYSLKCHLIRIENVDRLILYLTLVTDVDKARVIDRSDLLEMTSDGLFEYYSDTGELHAEASFFNVFGYLPSEFKLTYSRWIAMIHPVDVPNYLENFESLLIGQKTSASCEFRVLFKGGVYRWVKSNLKAFDLRKGKMPKKVIGSIVDVHEHRQIFEATKIIFKDMAKIRGRAFFRSMAYHVSNIVGVKYCVIAAPLDKDFCNMKALAFWENGDHLNKFEYPLAGTPCQYVIEDKSYKVYSNHVDELFPEDTYLSDNGIVSYWGVPFFDSNDEPMGHVFIMDDKPIVEEDWIDSVLRLFAASIGTELERNNSRSVLKEQKLYAENQVLERTRSLEEALVQLDTLFYRSSHDMRAPIATLEGLINILKSNKKEIESPEFMTLVEGNISDMKKLNASIGQIGNIRNHQIKVTRVRIKSVVDQVLESLKSNYSSQKSNVTIKIQDDLTFQTDEILLTEVLNNVIENALKFSQGINTEQQAQIDVSANIKDELLILEVRDNGVGVSSDQKEKIFKMFFRGNETKSGLGLGLFKTEIALSKIEGTIDVQSTVGKGTEAVISLLNLDNKKLVKETR